MMKKGTAAVVAVVLIAVAIAGCSQKAESGNTVSTDIKTDKQQVKSDSSGKLIEPNQLISKSEAERLIGEALTDGKNTEQKAVGMKLCIYNTAKADTNRFLQITLTQQAFMPANGQNPKAIYEAIRKNFPDAVKVSDIGDDAFIAPPGLHILKGSYYITVAVGNSQNEKNRETLKAAGKKAIENLEKSSGK